MDIVYFGSGAFGVPTLRSLCATHRVLAVITQPDKPAGRGGELSPTPVGQYAATSLPEVPLLKPTNVNLPEVLARVRAMGDGSSCAWVVVAFGQKLSSALLAERFAINLHASLLPRWRGAAPINAAMLAGDRVTGNTVITLADRMDAGLVLGQSHCEVAPHQTAGEVHDQLALDGPGLVIDVLARRAAGTLSPLVQDESLVTLAGKLSKGDGWVSFDSEAEACRRRIHGLTPWPGVTVTFRGQPLKLLRVAVAQAIEPASLRPGSLLDPLAGVVLCGEQSSLQLVTVQPAGGRAMAWSEFARGRQPSLHEMLDGAHPPGGRL